MKRKSNFEEKYYKPFVFVKESEDKKGHILYCIIITDSKCACGKIIDDAQTRITKTTCFKIELNKSEGSETPKYEERSIFIPKEKREDDEKIQIKIIDVPRGGEEAKAVVLYD